MKITKNEFQQGNQGHLTRIHSHLFKPRAKNGHTLVPTKKGRPKATLLRILSTNDQFVQVAPKKLKKLSKSDVATVPSPSRSPGQSLPVVPSNVHEPLSVLAIGS